ncbi:acyl-CoA ligase (AMP-forming), exosortase A system-associated [Thalassotalea fusca]
MTVFLHELLTSAVSKYADNPALTLKSTTLTYHQLLQLTNATARALTRLDISRYDRVGIYLGKSFENVACMLAASKIGATFVPINATLKAPQVSHIINDCTIRVLVTNRARLEQLQSAQPHISSLEHVVLVDEFEPATFINAQFTVHSWTSWLANAEGAQIADYHGTSNDMVAILYTSGSTGAPKGVVLSHSNLILGAQSVTTYLENSSADTLLALLPFSFDYGLNQLISAIYIGAHCVLLDYLLPRDIIRAIAKHQITGVAAVPPLWQQFIQLNVDNKSLASVRYFTNSGGALAVDTLHQLQNMMPNARPYLMYGLTEAFRSTFLPPEQVSKRPTSMGKAIPNAEILILRPDGSPCEVNEVGELVHCGPLVSLGYWNKPEATAKRFRPAPNVLREVPNQSMAVWSGDSAKFDEDGYLYFVSRNDEMIKSSGYRISPTEIEQCLYAVDEISGVVAFGVSDDTIGQAVCVVVEQNKQRDSSLNVQQVIAHCKIHLPNYMVPQYCHLTDKLPVNANGKIDRTTVKTQYEQLCRSAQ